MKTTLEEHQAESSARLPIKQKDKSTICCWVFNLLLFHMIHAKKRPTSEPICRLLSQAFFTNGKKTDLAGLYTELTLSSN